MFSKYHYLNHQIASTAKCYVAVLNGIPVGFCAVIHFPHPNKRKSYKKIHRIVVLPDYQGIGIAKFMLNEIANMYTVGNQVMTITSSSLSMYKALLSSPQWKLTRKGYAMKSKTGLQRSRQFTSSKRVTFSFEYEKP